MDSLPSIYIDSIADEKRKNVRQGRGWWALQDMWISLMYTGVTLEKGKGLCSQYLFSF